MDKDSSYVSGFIYMDSQAGLTFNNEWKFRIDGSGKFIRIESGVKKEVGFMKVRVRPKKTAVAEIPESKFRELSVEKIPGWLKFYKTEDDKVAKLYRWGYLYNEWNESEKALTFLEKADKIDSKFKGLQTELAFSYSALGKYKNVELCLKKTIVQNPNDCYTYKELAYTFTKLLKYEKIAATYTKMSLLCKENIFLQETAYNLAFEFYKVK